MELILLILLCPVLILVGFVIFLVIFVYWNLIRPYTRDRGRNPKL